MDPFSITAGVVGIADSVTKLSSLIFRLRHDYRCADEDLDNARQHALLLREEIKPLETRKAGLPHALNHAGDSRPYYRTSSQKSYVVMEEGPYTKAMSTAHDLLSTIESSFPLRSEPHTWRSKVRWALKDKQTLVELQERLKSAESTLQGIATMEQLRVSHMMYGLLIQQQSALSRLEKSRATNSNVWGVAVINQSSPSFIPTFAQTQILGPSALRKQSNQLTKKSTKLLPWTARFNQWGVSGQLTMLPKDESTSYRATVHVSVLSKTYSLQMKVILPGFTFDRMLHVRNIVPKDCAMVIACKTGDFDQARRLLERGEAQGSDITSGGWPMLDYAIESGSTRLVRLLLEYGATPNLAYGEHNMTAIQSAFLHGHLNIGRVLLNQGADIEHIDSDGYSVLSYLWVVDKPLEKSAEFMRFCLANDFGEVNTCDSRGWSAFHRAAAIGTSDDVETFLKLGASLELRAQWYGWTALFFAASHDNLETFQTIVRHSEPDVYESLDGDGWTLLHCCIYFGAPRIMRLCLQNGTNVNQLSLPSPLPEDPELSYRELSPSDIALYIGPNRYRMFMEALVETGRHANLQGIDEEMFWEAAPNPGEAEVPRWIYGAEDVDDDRWTLLHWASYNGSSKVRKLLLLKGVDPEHMDAVTLEENPTFLPKSPFENR